jgi:hypothetical protein
MKATHLLALATLTLACAMPAQARCKREAMPTVLEPIVVTPVRGYTMAEWKQHEAEKRQLAATAVTFAPLVVTPDYTITREERREYARARNHATPSAQASATPISPARPTLINFLRRLFN